MSQSESHSSDVEEAEYALLLAYVKRLRQREFYGIVELTFQRGELKTTRETRAAPAATLASELMDEIPQKYRQVLRDKYKDHESFGK